jgi:hypothetical protein
MPITHVRYLHRKPDPLAVPVNFEELEEDHTILFFDPVAEATVINVGELYRRLEIGYRANEIVVFRGAEMSFIEAIERDPILPDFLADKQVLALVGHTATGQPAPHFHRIPRYTTPSRDLSIDLFREVELTAIMVRSEAIFAHKEYHFELPSGQHAEKFVRLADAFRSIFDIRRFTDWVLPRLTGPTVVIADTGSMLPLLIDLREQARNRFGWHVEISTLDRYPQDAVAVSDAVAAIHNRPLVARAKGEDQPMAILFLISVNSSGRLCRLFKALDLPRSKIGVICATEIDEDKEACPSDFVLVTVPVERWDPNSEVGCAGCKASEVIRVHRETYELLPSIKRDEIKLEIKAAMALAEFWEIADETKAVQLHVDVNYTDHHGRQDYRHFSVYLKTAELAKHPTFRNRCIARLREEVREPNVILIPKHESSGMVINLCKEAFPGSQIVGQGRFPEDVQKQIRGAERILVADDAIVTGITLRNLRTELFRVTQQFEMDPEVNAFVMVARPADDEALLSITRKYRSRQVRKIVTPVQLYLPGARQCPWCDERRLLTSYQHRLSQAAQSLAATRIKKLTSPVYAQLLLVGPADRLPADPKTHGSFFGTLDQQTAFAAGVCAAQTIKLRLGSFGGIRGNVFDLTHAIHAYYEGVLLASILRTYNAVHVRYPLSDPKVQTEIAGLNQHQVYPGVIAELALAAIDNKIPSKELRKQLDAWKGQDPWLAMLTEIMDIVQPA